MTRQKVQKKQLLARTVAIVVAVVMTLSVVLMYIFK